MIDIEGFQSYLYEEELAPNTIAAYVRGVIRFSEMFDEITKQNLIAFKQHLIENFKPQTVNNRITAVLRYCDFKEIPMKLKPVKMPKKTYVDNVISCQQFETLIAGLKKDGNIHWYVNVMLLAKTGMRISEAIRICKKDVMNRQVDIYTKAHMRTVYFPKSLLDDIAKIRYGACKEIYKHIKDYDDDVCYGYAGRTDCMMFKDFVALVKECYDTKSDLIWC